MVEVITNFKFDNKKLLLVLDESNKSVILSTKNLKNVKTINASELNTYQVLWANNLMITENSLKQIEDILLNK